MIKFNLLNKKQDLTPIYLIYHYGASTPFRWSTGEKIIPKKKYWDFNKQRAKKTWANHRSLNAFLDRCAAIVQEVHTDYRTKGQAITKTVLKSALDNQTARPSQVNVVGLVEYMDEFIKGRELSGSYSPNTIKTYKRNKNTLLRFFKAKRVYEFEEIDLDFLMKLKEWMIGSNGYKSNYTKKVVQFLKMVMRQAHEKGHHKNTYFRSEYFTVKEKIVDKIALSMDEVHYLAEFDLQSVDGLTPGKIRSMDRIRDRFVVGCYICGQRFSDLFKINIDQMYEQDGQIMFRFVSRKTIRPTIIPVHPVVYSILEKYGGSLPAITNQKFNEQIKDFCELAELNDMTTIYEEKNGEVVKRAYPKYKLVSSHTMRRTFITNALAEGLPVTAIMDVTGITNYNTLMKYNKSQKDRSALTVSRSKLFTRKAEGQ